MRILITNSVPANGGDEALLRAAIEGMRMRWVTPEFETIELSSEVTCYRAHR